MDTLDAVLGIAVKGDSTATLQNPLTHKSMCKTFVILLTPEKFLKQTPSAVKIRAEVILGRIYTDTHGRQLTN
jgi:hypothetical protein